MVGYYDIVYTIALLNIKDLILNIRVFRHQIMVLYIAIINYKELMCNKPKYQ